MEQLAAAVVQAVQPCGSSAALQLPEVVQYLAVALKASDQVFLLSPNVIKPSHPCWMLRTYPSIISKMMQTCTLALVAAGSNNWAWQDLSVAAAVDASAGLHFLGIPLICHKSCECFGALLLGAAGPAELQVGTIKWALLLAQALAAGHSDELRGLSSVVTNMLLQPMGQQTGGRREDTDSDNESVSESGYSSDAATDSDWPGDEGQHSSLEDEEPAPSGRGPTAMEASAPPVHQRPPLALVWQTLRPLTLTFRDIEMERSFSAWHARSMHKLDIIGYLFCAAILVSVFFFTPAWMLAHKMSMRDQLFNWLGLLTTLPLILLVPDWYTRHRTQVLLWFTGHHVLFLLHVKNYIHFLDAKDFTRETFIAGYGWLTVTFLLLQHPFSVMAFWLPTVAALNLTLLPEVCATFISYGSMTGCLARVMIIVLLRGVLLPLCVVYIAELRARQAFAASLSQQRHATEPGSD